MARALDLEVMLVPRKFVPAVQAITRRRRAPTQRQLLALPILSTRQTTMPDVSVLNVLLYDEPIGTLTSLPGDQFDLRIH